VRTGAWKGLPMTRYIHRLGQVRNKAHRCLPSRPCCSVSHAPVWRLGAHGRNDCDPFRPWRRSGGALDCPHRPGWKGGCARSNAGHKVETHATTIRTRVDSLLRDRHPETYSRGTPHVSELRKLGAIEPVNQRCKNKSGILVHYWRAVVTNVPRKGTQ
jgi:hypothetical protein